MASDECRDAGNAGSGDCSWKRLEVCCALWGGPCRYLGSIGGQATGGQRLDVRNGQVAESGTQRDPPHQQDGDADPDERGMRESGMLEP